MLDSKEITRPHIVRVHWGADCLMEWFIILGSTDYNYTFTSLPGDL